MLIVWEFVECWHEECKNAVISTKITRGNLEQGKHKQQIQTPLRPQFYPFSPYTPSLFSSFSLFAQIAVCEQKACIIITRVHLSPSVHLLMA